MHEHTAAIPVKKPQFLPLRRWEFLEKGLSSCLSDLSSRMVVWVGDVMSEDEQVDKS